MCPVSRCRRGLRRDPSGSALPIIPQSVSRGARLSRLHWFAFATACQVARPPGRIGQSFPGPPGTFTSRLPAGRSPFPPLDMTTTATGLLCWRDFHPQEWQLASLHRIGPSFPGPPGTFTSRLPTGRSPFPLLDMPTTATGLLCWRDFHPQEWQLASLHRIEPGRGPVHLPGQQVVERGRQGVIAPQHLILEPDLEPTAAGDNGERAVARPDRPESAHGSPPRLMSAPQPSEDGEEDVQALGDALASGQELIGDGVRMHGHDDDMHAVVLPQLAGIREPVITLARSPPRRCGPEITGHRL